MIIRDRQKFAEWVRDMRTKRGMSQGELAYIARLGYSTVSLIETGKKGSIKPGTFVTLLMALGVTAGQITEVMRRMEAKAVYDED